MNLRFAGPYQRQNWSIPDSIIYNMAMNPSSSNVYQKLIKCCKYFFSKNRIIVLQCLHFYEDGWKTCAFSKNCEMKRNEMRKLDIGNISAQFWIKEVYHLIDDNFSITPSYILPKLYRCDVQHCYLYQQTMTLKQYLFLASSAQSSMLSYCTVTGDDGLPLQLETIVANLPKLQRLKVEFIPNAPNISSKTVKELLKLPQLSKMTKILLYNVTEAFDIDAFFEYFKETTDVQLFFSFVPSLSNAYKQRLEAVIDEILNTPFSTYRTPYIEYPGQNMEKKIKMLIRYKKDFPI